MVHFLRYRNRMLTSREKSVVQTIVLITVNYSHWLNILRGHIRRYINGQCYEFKHDLSHQEPLCQFHAPVALTRRKNPYAPINRRVGGHKCRLRCRSNGKEKIPTSAGNRTPLIEVVSTRMKEIIFSNETESSFCQFVSCTIRSTS
jgi:hypothetical protein